MYVWEKNTQNLLNTNFVLAFYTDKYTSYINVKFYLLCKISVKKEHSKKRSGRCEKLITINRQDWSGVWNNICLNMESSIHMQNGK